MGPPNISPDKTSGMADRTITISADHDTTVTVKSPSKGNGPANVTHFKCEAEALASYSEYFAKSRKFNAAHGHSGTILEGDNPAAIRVWLIYMHAAKNSKSDPTDLEDESMEYEDEDEGPFDHISDQHLSNIFRQDGVRDTTRSCIWDIITAGDKYLLKGELLYDFFERWYTENVDWGEMDDDDARGLAFPCYMFDYAEGFTEVTKWLAYNSVGHITEKRPPGFKLKHMHLAPPDFVGPMNQARGRLKTVLHSRLCDPAYKILKQGRCSDSCDHWAKSVGMYFSDLLEGGVYPLETVWPRSCANEVLGRLASLSCNRTGECDVCIMDWDPIVTSAWSVTKDYFDGLCLDCMQHSLLERGRDPDDEYWSKNEAKLGRWDHGCRVKHGNPTWYSSWLGRSEHRQKLVREASKV